MVRRTFRIGLWLGLLVGLAWAVRRTLLLRRAAERVDVSPDPWTPVLPFPDPPAADPPAADSAPVKAPVAPVTEPAAPPPRSAAAPAPVAALSPTAPPTPPPAAPDPAPPTATKPLKTTTKAARIWAPPLDGECPPGHPVKAKLSSRTYRIPGSAGYDRARPDRCYRAEEDAIADGFTKAKR